MTEKVISGQETLGDGISTDSLFNSYIAGYFDGEGCVRVVQPNKGVGIHVFITNTYLPLLNKIKHVYGGSVALRSKSNSKHRTCYQWRLSSKKGIKSFLESILPYLIEKKDQAVLGIKFCNLPAIKVNRYSKDHFKVLQQREVRVSIANKLKQLKRVDHEFIQDKP